MSLKSQRAGTVPTRRKAERWPLRPGDLPEPRFVNQDAALGEAKENAVFRAMVFGLRSRGIWSRLPPWPRGIVVGLSVIALTGIFSTFWPGLLVIWLVARNQRSTLSRFFSIPEILLEELAQTPQGPRDWTLALWARSLRPGGRSATPVALLTFFSVSLGPTFFVAVMVGPPPAQIYAWIGGSAGMLIGVVPLILRPTASGALPGVARKLRAYRIELQRRRNPLLRFFFLILRLTAIFAVLIIATSALVSAILALSDSGIPAAISRWAAHPSAPGICFAAGLLLATGSGMAWRRRVRLRRDDTLMTLDREMEKVLEFLRLGQEPERERSPRGSVPRAIRSRPPGRVPASSETASHHVR